MPFPLEAREDHFQNEVKSTLLAHHREVSTGAVAGWFNSASVMKVMVQLFFSTVIAA